MSQRELTPLSHLIQVKSTLLFLSRSRTLNPANFLAVYPVRQIKTGDYRSELTHWIDITGTSRSYPLRGYSLIYTFPRLNNFGEYAVYSYFEPEKPAVWLIQNGTLSSDSARRSLYVFREFPGIHDIRSVFYQGGNDLKHSDAVSLNYELGSRPLSFWQARTRLNLLFARHRPRTRK